MYRHEGIISIRISKIKGKENRFSITIFLFFMLYYYLSSIVKLYFSYKQKLFIA